MYVFVSHNSTTDRQKLINIYSINDKKRFLKKKTTSYLKTRFCTMYFNPAVNRAQINTEQVL